MNHFYKMWTDAIEGRSNYIPIEVHWNDVPGRDEKWKEETIRNTSEEQFRQEFECCWGDTMVQIKDNETGEVMDVKMEDLHSFL